MFEGPVISTKKVEGTGTWIIFSGKFCVIKGISEYFQNTLRYQRFKKYLKFQIWVKTKDFESENTQSVSTVLYAFRNLALLSYLTTTPSPLTS